MRQGHAAGKAAESDARERAFVDLLAWSQTFALRVTKLVTTVENRSGLAEGIAVTLRQRAPLDPMTLQDWMDVDLRPLMDACSRAWACASPPGVELSNAVLDACLQLTAVLSTGPKLTGAAKLRVAFLGAIQRADAGAGRSPQGLDRTHPERDRLATRAAVPHQYRSERAGRCSLTQTRPQRASRPAPVTPPLRASGFYCPRSGVCVVNGPPRGTQLPVRRCGAARWPNRHQGGGAKKHPLMPRAGSTVGRICRRGASGE